MIVQVIRDAEERLKGRGRLLVRLLEPSTKIRVMVEADEKRLADTLARRIAEAIKKTMSRLFRSVFWQLRDSYVFLYFPSLRE